MASSASQIETAKVTNCVIGHVVGVHRSQDQRVEDAVFHDTQTPVGSIEKNCNYFKPEMTMDEVVGALVFYASKPLYNLGLTWTTEAVCGALCKYRKSKTTRHEKTIYERVTGVPIPMFPTNIR